MSDQHDIPDQVVIELSEWLKGMSGYKRGHMLAAMKRAGEMDLSLTSVPKPPPRKPVCQECESDDIITDAWAYWDVEKQDWQISQAFEKGGCCEACGAQDIRFDWVEA